MDRTLAGDMARPQDLMAPAAAVIGGFGLYVATIEVGGADYVALGIGLATCFLGAICVGYLAVARAIRDRDERRYELITLAYQLCDAAAGNAHTLLSAKINALPSATERETILLMADGQNKRTAPMADTVNGEKVRSLATEIRRDEKEILRSKALIKEVNFGVSTLANWLCAQTVSQAGKLTQRSPEHPTQALPPNAVAYVVAELRRLAELGLAA